MVAVADGAPGYCAAVVEGGIEIVDGGVRVAYWCTLSEMGRRHCVVTCGDVT